MPTFSVWSNQLPNEEMRANLRASPLATVTGANAAYQRQRTNTVSLLNYRVRPASTAIARCDLSMRSILFSRYAIVVLTSLCRKNACTS